MMASNRLNNQRITVDILGRQAETTMEVDSDSQEDEPLLSQAPLKRKLLDEFDINRPSLDPPPDQHMKVYLRIRPFSSDEINKNEKQDCLSVENEHIVSTHPPKDSHTYRNASRGLGKTMTKFTFSHIFNENTSQKEFFNDTMLGLVKDFIDGQNCLVFSYGVTSSGKTYTIQGNPKDAGMLPRALDVLFNSISGQQWEPMNLKPKLFMGVQRLTADEELHERKIKERVLKLSCDADMDVMSLLGDDASDISVATNTTTCSESSNISSMDFKESIDSTEKLFAELNNRVREEARVNVQDQGNIKFSVWVSFAEIYNEQIYDLLEPMPKKKNARRPCLKLSEDRNGSPYIKGLKEVNVNSADEAYKLLTIGQRNLQTACTKLNHSSSRSHCIFNIKIVRVVDKEDPHVARVSMLSLCDLAGSERYTKSQTTGERLKEAGNINTSLLTLGRCIETLKYNQLHKDHTRIVPFRDSKLTRLFQNFFVGRGKAAMIVNVNQCASMFDETLHVFKFSAIASQVVVVQKPVFVKPKLPVITASPNPIPRTSIMWATPAKTSGLANENEAVNVPLPEDDNEDLEEKMYTQENIDELITIIEGLQQELSVEKLKAIKMEAHIRSEVVEEMKKQFIDIEEEYSDEVLNREQLAEELAEKRMQILVESKLTKTNKSDSVTDEDDEWVSSVLLHQEKVKVENREKEITRLTERIGDLDTKLKTMTEGQEKAEKERSNMMKRLEDSQKVNDELQKELSAKNTSYMENLQKQLSEYEDKIKELEKSLEKASEKEESEEGEAALVENLTQQLTQSRDQVRDQEKEISELNDMLTEAGETFQQREMEIQKLKDLVQDYEKRLEQQNEAIKVMEQAAADSRVAMETADQSLTKREECVSTLQSEIRELQGDVQKYRNKAKFFEESLVEREQEASQWKHKYEQDREEHSKSQEALIHGFTAEISNLKSQIFHFKTQLYSVKSPTKSHGVALKSPDVKSGQLFSPDSKVKASTPKGASHKDNFTHTVQEEIIGLQSEMDKNVASISELEHSLHVSRSAVNDLEQRLKVANEKNKLAENEIRELETRLESFTDKSDSSYVHTLSTDLKDAKHKVTDLENQLKIKVEKLAKQADSELEMDNLNEQLTLKNKKILDLETERKHLEKQVCELKQSLQQDEDKFEKLEHKKEELEVLNSELKEMVNKTTNDLQTKELELQILSPKSADKSKHCNKTESDDSVENERLRHELDCKYKEIDILKEKLIKLKAGFKAEEILLKEANSKYSDLEFRIDEKEIENQDLKKKKKEYHHKIEDLEFGMNEKSKELTNAGEELAFAKTEVEKLKRIKSEKEAIILTKESEINELTQKLKSLDKSSGSQFSAEAKSAVSEEIDSLKKSHEEKTEQILSLEEDVKNVEEKNRLMQMQLSKVDGLNEEIMKLQNLLKGKEAKVSELNCESKLLKDEVDKLNSCIKENETLQKEILQLRSTLCEKEEEMAMLSDNLSAMLDEKEIEEKHSAEARKLKDRIHQLEKELHDRQNQILKNCDVVALQNKSENIDIIESQKALLNSQNEKIKDLETKLNCASEQMRERDNLELSMRDLESAVVDKEVELCDKDKQVELKTAEVDCLAARIGFLETELKTRNEEVKELQCSNENKVCKVKELTVELESVKQQLSDSFLKTEGLKTSIKSWEETSNCFEQEAKSLKDQLNEQVACNEVNAKEIRILKGKIKCVLEKNNSLEISIEEKSAELKELKASYNEMKRQNESSSTDLSKLADAMCEIAELKSVVHTHKTLHHKVKGELEEALLELENKRSETNSLNNEKVKNLENELNDKIMELKEATQKVSGLQKELKKSEVTNLKLEEIQRDLEEARNTIQQLGNQADTLRSDLERSQNNERQLENKVQITYSEVNDKMVAVSEMKKEVETLLAKKKTTIKCLEEEKKVLESELVKFKSENKQEVNDLLEEIEGLKQDLQTKTKLEAVLKSEKETEITKAASIKEDMQKLSLVIDDLKCENNDLRNELQELKCEKTQLEEVNNEKTELQARCNNLTTELVDLKDLLKKEENQCTSLTEEVRKLEKLQGSQNEINNKFDEANIRLKNSELQAMYDAEKLKNEEYQKMLNDMNEQNCLSPQNGVRRLRKEKIDAENALIEARFTISSLEKKIKDAELTAELKQTVHVNNVQSASASESVLQQKLTKATSKLLEAENNNRSLIKEVTQLQGMVEKLENDLKEEKQKFEMMVEAEACQKSVASVVQADPRQSISSPSTKVELSKSREREQGLYEQLNKTKVAIQEWSRKFTTIENDLQQKTQELQDTKDKLATLERIKQEGSKLTDEELQRYQDRISELEKDIICKEEELESKTHLIDDLRQQLETGQASVRSFKQDMKARDETIAVLKETLGEQENMLQLQEEYINKKEAEISSNKTEYQSLLDKYQTVLLTKDSTQHEHLEEAKLAARTEAERDLLKRQLEEAELKLQRAVDDRERTNQLMKEVEHKLDRAVDDKERTNQMLREVEHKLERAGEERERANKNLMEMESKLQRVGEERDRLSKALTDNNQELKDMEKVLTEVRKECEDLRSQGSDKHAETRLEDLRHDLEKKIHGLEDKNKELNIELKDVKAKFHMTKETLKVAVEERRGQDKSLKEFREERDKLVSGLESILKKKDIEIKQHKDLIKQLKEKEEQITKNWHEEREKIGSGLQQLEKNICKVKTEPSDEDSSSDNRPYTSPVVRKGSYREAMTQLSPSNNVVPSSNSRTKPPCPEPPQAHDGGEILQSETQGGFKSPVRRTSSRSRSQAETPQSANSSVSSTQQRGSSRRGKKRSSPVHREDDLPPRPPKRVSTDTSMVSESDDVSSHLQVDATPTVAAKTLRRTRKKNGSQLDLTAVEESTGTRPQRSSKRSARSRILESFRESPIGRGSKRILDNIAEAFSPKSPTKENNPNTDFDKKSHGDSKENLVTPSNLEVQDKKPSGRGRGRHRLYKEDTYISEPMEFKGEFVKSPDDVHKTVTRSLRSRRH